MMFDRLSSTDCESSLLRAFGGGVEGSILAGISRSLRLTYQNRDTQDEVAIETAASVIGPLAFMFVWWVLSQALQQGVRRLYFLARDGEIFYKVAKTLIEKWQLDIEVHYLYCSRETLLLPGFRHAGNFEIDWITWAYTGNITWAEICRRVGVTVEESDPFVREVGCEHLLADSQKIIDPADRPILSLILKIDGFEALVRTRVQPHYELTREYLQQEGLLDGVRFAVVDTGWRGSSQYALSSLLTKSGDHPEGGIIGYYIGLNCDAHEYAGDLLKGFLFDWRNMPRDYQLYNFICYEMLCSAAHGRTLGYQRDGSLILPIFGSEIKEEIARLVEHHHRVGIAYAQRAADHFLFSEFKAEAAARATREQIRRFICRPNLGQAAVYGDWPMASEIRENDMQPIAPPMNFSRFVRNAVGIEKVHGFWPQASLVRGEQPVLVWLYNVFLSFSLLDWYRRVVLRY